MSSWFHAGEPIDSVAIDDRAFQYGDGLFETIAIRAGKARLWDYHMQRLSRGCSTLGIAMPDVAELHAELAAAIDRSREDPGCCLVKIVVSAGVGQRGYGRQAGRPGIAYVGVFPAEPVPDSAYTQGVETLLCSTRLAGPAPTAGLKTLNRLEQVLGRSEVIAAGAFEGLMRDAEGRLICGTMSNVFIVTAQTIKTPALDRCGVEGVMRRLTIESLRSSGLAVDVCDIGADDLREYDEVFLTNSQFGALPVRGCDEVRWSAGTVTRDCLAILADAGIAECRV